jgi:hypothetical protein
MSDSDWSVCDGKLPKAWPPMLTRLTKDKPFWLGKGGSDKPEV